MQTMQASRPQSERDPVPPQASRAKLMNGYNSMLPRGNSRDLDFRLGDFLPHVRE
jgi:hypothetical protein